MTTAIQSLTNLEQTQISADNLVWMDLELTGLDLAQSKIIEIAVLITDKNLEILAEGPSLIINQSDEVLNAIDYSIPVFKGFLDSGFIEQVRTSTLTQSAAELMVLDFIKQYVPANVSPLCGNSVYMDRMFIIKNMPLLNSYLHYRLIDITTLKELYLRLVKNPVPYVHKPAHRALDDIRDSVNELKYYQEHFLKL